MSWFSQIIENLIKLQTDKIDLVAVNGLNGVNNSLAYKVHEIERHFHNSEQVFGNNSGYLGADLPVVLTVIGGDNAWGTENHIHAGDVIESGSSVKKMDINTLYVVAVSTANKISIIELLYGTAGNDITGTVEESTEVYTRTGGDPMLIDNDKVIITALTNITGPIATEVYYVTDVSGSTFKLSRTIGGSSVALGGSDGTFTVKKLTQTSLTKAVISAPGVTSDAHPYIIISPRIPCNSRIFIRAKSETGSTITISYLVGLHTYEA